MKKQYRSNVLASVHETAEGLTGAGVMSKQTNARIRRAVPDAGAAVDTGGNSATGGKGRGELS